MIIDELLFIIAVMGYERSFLDLGDWIRKLKIKNQKAKLQINPCLRHAGARIQNNLLLTVIDILYRISVVDRRYLIVSVLGT